MLSPRRQRQIRQGSPAIRGIRPGRDRPSGGMHPAGMALATPAGVDDRTRDVIMDDNPVPFTRHIDVRYPKTRSYSTVPANVLALLPRLPDDIEYRFLGPHMILLDIRANAIVDRMRCAIRCDD